MQIFLFFLGLLLLFLVASKIKRKNNYIGVILGLLWIWTGLIYHIIYFTEINKVALVFGSVFILEGILIFIESFRKMASSSLLQKELMAIQDIF